MPKRRGGGGGGGRIGGFILSILIIAVLGGVLFAVGKANNISSSGGVIDWARQTSSHLKGCLDPDVKFWKCGFGGGGSSDGGSKDNGGSTGGDKGGSAGGSNSGDKGGSGGSGSTGGSNQQPAGSAELKKLATIKVAESQDVDYDRSQWKHWIGDRCNDTRQQVLREQAESFKLDADGCRVVSGKWIDPYTGKTFTDPGKLDIDHVYSLGAAASHGGNDWSAAKKQKYANDKTHLLAVSASANRSKSDRNPAEWWPENTAFSCEFATKYVDSADNYGLSFSKADVKALEKGLKTCSK